ncbi:MAG TPA: amidohydrolase [Mycobacteriales bacterium]|nr:amidohydrolase [Mycobacteriales bacterium]
MSGTVAQAWLDEHGTALVEVRRHLHRHPELSGEEHATTALVSDRLRAAGLEPRRLPGTGLVCDVGGREGGPTVVLRADLDALPIQDTTSTPWRSTVANVSHACGHDVHTTAVLGAGLALAARDRQAALPGRVRLLFQAAEERLPGGALDAIAAGAVDGASLAFALHCDPTLTVGHVGVREGAITAATDQVRIELRGPGGHTSRPDRSVDLVGAVAALASQLPLVLARRLDARHGTALVWGSVHAGVAPNAIPDRAELTGTVRTLDIATWRAIPKVLEESAHAIVAPWGASITVEHRAGVPPVVNDPGAARLFVEAADAALGPGAAVPTRQSLGGEDFAWYLDRVPGAMARLGTRPRDWSGPDLDLHQGAFDVDEDAIGIGVEVLVGVALAALDAPS